MDDCLSLPRGTTKKAIGKWEANLACAPIDMKTPSKPHVESMDGGGFSIVKCKKTKAHKDSQSMGAVMRQWTPKSDRREELVLRAWN
jgi:hypothetical protein